MRHAIVVFAFVLGAGLFVSGDLDAGSLEPPGPPGPTMKTLQQIESRTPITSMPIIIAASGSYYLTGDLIGTSGQFGISITSSYVTLDLNGYSLIGVGGSLEGIRANGFATRHVVIRNGVIRNWGGGGIAASLATEVHLEDVRVDNNVGTGVLVGPRSIVRNTTSSGNSAMGIFADAGSQIIGCTAGGNGTAGIATGQNAVVSSSSALNNTGVIGFTLNSGSACTDCTAQGNGTGFNVGAGSRVVHSVARANSTGILGNDGVAIEGCTIELNTDDGIRIASRGFVRGNLMRGNTNDGIQATGSQNRIEDNQSTINGAGIRVDGTNNLVVKNSVGGNNFEYLIAGGNQVGTITSDPTTANQWANFDL